jgi:hypothetical protein
MLVCPFDEKYKYLLSADIKGYFSSVDVFTFGPRLTNFPIDPSANTGAS